jgi:DNA-binding transcriptional ArsR family regulator
MAYETMLQTLADATRQRIVASLAGKSLTVGDIAAGLPISRPAVSQHLKILRDAGWVRERREGTRHYFSVDPAAAAELRDYFETMWQDAMCAFSQHVTREERKRGRK